MMDFSSPLAYNFVLFFLHCVDQRYSMLMSDKFDNYQEDKMCVRAKNNKQNEMILMRKTNKVVEKPKSRPLEHVINVNCFVSHWFRMLKYKFFIGFYSVEILIINRGRS